MICLPVCIPELIVYLHNVIYPASKPSFTTRPQHLGITYYSPASSSSSSSSLSIPPSSNLCNGTCILLFLSSPQVDPSFSLCYPPQRNYTSRKKPDRMYICITGVRGWPAEAIVGLHQHFPILITRLIGFSFRFISSVSVLSLSLLCPSTHSPSSSFFSYLSSVYSLFSFFARSVCCSSSSSCRDVLYLHIFFVSLFVRPSVLPSVFDRLVFSSSA